MIGRAKLAQLAQELIGYAQHVLGPNIGITLFTFEFGDRGNASYISNCKREDMIATVREWLARQEAGLDSDPPGPRGRG